MCLSTSYYFIFLCLTVEIRQESRFGLPEEVNAVLLINTNVAGIGLFKIKDQVKSLNKKTLGLMTI